MLLTIFTPTYNRAELLPRLYESLCSQTYKNFEWLVVDDGSTDNTEKVIHTFIEEKKLTIRYYCKENGGKHTAHNLAVTKAAGDFFFCVDSDDWLLENAVSDIKEGLMKMSDKDYALVGYKILENGQYICKKFSAESGKQINFYRLLNSSGGGEYSIVLRTEFIKNKPFPEIKGEKFSTEAILYDRLDLDGYTVRLCPCVLTVCEYQEDGLSNSLLRCLRDNPIAYQIYHMQRIDLVCSLRGKFIHAVKYQSFKRLSKNTEYLYCGKHKILVLIAYVPGLLGALYYRFRVKD